MKKTVLLLGLTMAAGIFVAHCGGGSSANDPSTAKASFDSPEGTITSSNAATVMNDTLNSANGAAVQGLSEFAGIPGVSKLAAKGLPTGFMEIRKQGEQCITGDQNSATIDFECIVDAVPELSNCTASGSMSFSVDGAIITVTYNSVSLVCPGEINVANLDGELLYLFNQDIPTDGSTPTVPLELWIFCADITATVDGITETFSGCIGIGEDYLGFYLVEAEDGKVVAKDVKKDSSCTKVCADFDTGDGEVSVTCDVVDPTTGCNTQMDIEEIDNCTVATTPCGNDFTDLPSGDIQ